MNYRRRSHPNKLNRLSFAFAAVLFAVARAAAQDVSVSPNKPGGIYERGEKVTWTLSLNPAAPTPAGKYSFRVKENNFTQLSAGEIDLSSGSATINASLDEPGMLFLDVTAPAPATKPSIAGAASQSPGNNAVVKHVVAGAAVAPTQIQPDASRPADFDSFWASKIETLKQVPPNPVLTPGDSGTPDVDYATIRMDHVNGTHVYGQIAKPSKQGKYPALVIFQWAGPPYPLQKEWVLPHAAKGWLVLNIEPHDVLPTEPKSYYDALPESIKHYESIGNDDRDKSYFVEMYLRDYRAVEYLASRPDWDGKTMVVMGTSMGGQQSLAVAGLNPRITHLLVDVPAGSDTNGPLHGRQIGYPMFPPNNPKVMETALYVDPVNFASRIKATCLVAMGFVDTLTPPAGQWTTFNQIKAPKEAVPMIDSPHNHLATPAQQMPWTKRSAEWLDALVKGQPVRPDPNGAKGMQVSPASDSAPGGATPAFDDYQNMLDQLGIRSVRRGPNPNDQSTFDEAVANPYKDTLPDVLKMKDGTRVSTPEQWAKRRAEIAEDFEREVYGRIPENVPPVKWEVTETKLGESGGIPTITKTLLGHVDNSAYPELSVNIEATYTVPADTKEPVPTMIEFGFRWPSPPTSRPGGATSRPRPRSAGIPWTQQAIAKGWGYATIYPTSYQPDNNKLTTGIIGLTNKGQPRKPDQWGALRAWQWGVSRLVDYFEANPDSMVDAKHLGIEGLSRFGKAAIVTLAFEPRIAVGLIGSSGEGGTKLHRHIFGEAVENLAGGEYYWMAGNFIKYGASDPNMTAADIPVDSHELIAMCAPRLCFISHGIVEHGDAKWIDAHGSFMAAVLASPVYALLGKDGLRTPGDYLTDRMPPVGTLIGGELAWRQHEGGHEVTPNWPSFFEWVGKYITATPPPRPASLPATSAAAPVSPGRADEPQARGDSNSKIAHAQLVEKARTGGIDLYFLGDSITRRWGCSDPAWARLYENWKSNFWGWNAADFGWGADQIQNILWRVENGELDGVNPKVIVILAGTNNVGNVPGDDAKVAEISRGLEKLLRVCQSKAPAATIILTGIFPRNDNIAVVPEIDTINANLEKLADGKRVRYVNINDKLADATGKLYEGMTFDNLHPTAKGYQFWADALRPHLEKLLGPRAQSDHAPPPTCDPSILKNAAP